MKNNCIHLKGPGRGNIWNKRLSPGADEGVRKFWPWACIHSLILSFPWLFLLGLILGLTFFHPTRKNRCLPGFHFQSTLLIAMSLEIAQPFTSRMPFTTKSKSLALILPPSFRFNYPRASEMSPSPVAPETRPTEICLRSSSCIPYSSSWYHPLSTQSPKPESQVIPHSSSPSLHTTNWPPIPWNLPLEYLSSSLLLS